jgi:hypothetical protein
VNRKTFAEILEEARIPCARSSFKRARAASQLRHAARSTHSHRAAQRLSVIKTESILLAMTLAPEHCYSRPASDAPHLLSIKFLRLGRLHLRKEGMLL